MSMSADLKDLKRQRREELKALHVTYLRTKREVQRAASPARIVRKHLGVGLGVAALAGFLLAPRPSARVKYVRVPAEKAEEAAKKSNTWMNSLLKMLGPKLAAYIPGMDGKAGETEVYGPPPPKHGGGMSGAFIKGLLPLLSLVLKKVNVQKIIDQVMAQVSGGVRDARGKRNGDSQGQPDVSIADVGTVKPTDFDNFD